MAIIIDPDDLSQGTSNAVSDAVWVNASGAEVVISSSGGNLPDLGPGMVFEVRDHSVEANNGLYQESGGSIPATNGSLTCTKIDGVNPANAASEAINVLGSAGVSNEKSVHFDTSAREIWVFEQGNISSDGVTLQCLYSFAKEEWKADALLIKFDFPLVAITPEQFEFSDLWNPSGSSGVSLPNVTRKLIRTGGWSELDADGNIVEQYAGIITLGNFEDNDNDVAYYQLGNDPTDTTATIDFSFAGPVNEAVLTFNEIGNPDTCDFATSTTITRATGSFVDDGFRVGGQVTIRGSASNDGTYTVTGVAALTLTASGATFTTGTDTNAVLAVDNRNALTVFLRVRDNDTNGKIYAQSDLAAIGLSALTNKAERFPLSSATDLKISATDATISGNTPYTDIVIRYFDQAFNREVDSGTNRNFGIVIDVGTHSGVDGSFSASGNVLTTAEGGTEGFGAGTYTSGTLQIHEGTDENTVFTIDSHTDTTFTVSSFSGGPATFTDTETDISFTAQRATGSIIEATAEEIYEKVQYLLRQAADIDTTDQTVAGNTADELLRFVGDTLEAGQGIPSNPNGGGSGVAVEGFDSNDTNRITFFDNTGTSRTFPFVAAGTINFNTNLSADSDPEYWMFFDYTTRTSSLTLTLGLVSGDTANLTSTGMPALSVDDYVRVNGMPSSANNGVYIITAVNVSTSDYNVRKIDGSTLVAETSGGTASMDQNPIDSPSALIVNNNDGNPISGAANVASVGFDFDYDGNVQGGRTAATEASVVLRAIGLETGQFVETSGTITRATGLSSRSLRLSNVTMRTQPNDLADI